MDDHTGEQMGRLTVALIVGYFVKWVLIFLFAGSLRTIFGEIFHPDLRFFPE